MLVEGGGVGVIVSLIVSVRVIAGVSLGVVEGVGKYRDKLVDDGYNSDCV